MDVWIGNAELASPASQLFATLFLGVMLTRLFRFALSAFGLGS